MKGVLKEIIISALICIVILFAVCIVFYKKMPSNQVIPSRVQAYEAPDIVKKELEEEIVEYPKHNIVFEITDSDINIHKQEGTYDEGRADPFADIISEKDDETKATKKDNNSSNSDSSNTTKQDKTENKTEETQLK